MKLLDLPPELLHAILTEAVLLGRLKRAMRLRLVNKRLSQEVLQVVFETHLPDTRRRYSIKTERLWQSYIVYRVITEKGINPSMFTLIRRTAETLRQSDALSDDTTLRAYIDGLCCLATSRNYHGFNRHRIGNARQRGGFVVPQDSFDNEAIWKKGLLVAAAYIGQTATVQRLLAEGYDPTDMSHIFGSATQAAAVQGNNEVLKLILSLPLSGPSYLLRKRLAILGATQGGNLDTVNLILEFRWGSILIPANQEIYSKALRDTLHTNNPAVFGHIAQLIGSQGEASPEICLPTLLAQAANHGHLDMVRHLVGIGAPVNGDGKNPTANPLRSASLKGHTDIVKLLLKHGARPRLGWSDTLTSAAKSGYLDIVRILLDHGADINESPAEDLRAPPAIVSAIQLEHEEMFHFLLKRGAVLKTPETGGRALKIAVRQGLKSMVELLLREGVEVEESHIDTASKRGDDEIARILRQRMEIPRQNSYSALVWQKMCSALTKTMHSRLTFNAHTEKTHAPQKQPHSAPHTSSSPPSTLV